MRNMRYLGGKFRIRDTVSKVLQYYKTDYYLLKLDERTERLFAVGLAIERIEDAETC